MTDYIKRLQSKIKYNCQKTLSRKEIEAILGSFSLDENSFEEAYQLLVDSAFPESSSLTLQNSNNIVLAETQELVANTAKSLEIQLFSEDVRAIASSLSLEFRSRRELLSSITEAILAYTRDAIAKEEILLEDAIKTVKVDLSLANSNLRSKLQGLNKEVNQANTDFKSTATTFRDLFAIS